MSEGKAAVVEHIGEPVDVALRIDHQCMAAVDGEIRCVSEARGPYRDDFQGDSSRVGRSADGVTLYMRTLEY